MTRRGRITRIVAVAAAVLGLVVGGMATGEVAYAAGDSVTITPTANTLASGVVQTYTLGITCSTSPSCGNSTVTIPTTAVTGDGALTDFGSWITSPRTCPAPTISAGQASFAFPDLTNGSQSCTFSVRAPNKTTLDGAQATIAPTINTAGGSTPSAVPAILSLTAGHHDSMGSSTPANVFSGAPLVMSFSFSCGTNAGDLPLSDLQISNVLPAGFTFQSLATAPIAANLQGTITTPAGGSSGGTISYVGNGHDCDNPASNRISFTVSGTAAVSGVADALGTQICQSAVTSSFTYIDGFSTTATPPTNPCATVVDINFTSAKGVDAGTFGNSGQYKASDGTTPNRYTFPGDWDQSGGDTSFNVNASTSPTTTNSGLSYTISDPLPCLDNVTGVTYNSNATGVACAHPAYIAKTITASGFTPAAGAIVDLLFADGTTGTAAYVTGAGWTLPATPSVSEIDFRPYVEEGNNSGAVITFKMSGYVAATAVPGRIVGNTATVSAVYSGTTNAVKISQFRSASILVADASADGRSGTVVYPSMAAAQVGTTCVERITFNPSVNNRNRIELAQAPSQAIYLDYLSPVGAGAIASTTETFTLDGTDNGHSYTASNLAATLTPNYNGTGRTRVQWTIPAGVVTVPGQYNINNTTGFTVALPAGCAGKYQNAYTLGYGAPSPTALIQGCVSTQTTGLQQVPLNPPGDTGLTANGSPIFGNYCGFSAPLTITPILPKFTVSKSVQGDLDSSPVSGGGIGKVSPTGGTASYTVSFTNNGQSNLHDPVMYDILPRVGDTEASSADPRLSQFAVTLTGVISPADPNVTVLYSTATNPCRPEVLASNPGCRTDWSTTPPSPLSSTTALEFTYSGTVGVGGSPISSFAVTYSVSTPSTSVGNVAWNSVGTNVHIGDTGDPADTTDFLGAAESPKTGLTASSNVPAIVKAAGSSTFDHVGQVVTFTFDVTNNAGTGLASVDVTDAFTDAPAGESAPTVTGPTGPLADGDTAHYNASYVVTQADLDHGSLTDVATATGTSAGGGTISNTSNAVTVTAVASPSLTLTKSASRAVVAATTDTVTYSFLVTNTGNQTVHGVAIDDGMLPSGTAITCPVTTLAPTASTTCTADYSPTTADLAAGSIGNTATATSLAPSGAAVTSAASSATVAVASLSLAKSANRATVGQVGDVVTYSFLIENTGTATVSSLAIVDPMLAVTCPSLSLAAAASETCTQDYTVVQADLDAGSIVNTAHVTGTASGATSVTSASSTATVSVVQNAELTLSETADTSTVTAVGHVVHYTFHAVNTGNLTLTNVTVTPGAFTGTGPVPTIVCPAAPITLVPGSDVTCTASYTAVAADLQLVTLNLDADAAGSANGATVAADPATTQIAVVAPAAAAVAGLLARTGVAGLQGLGSLAAGLLALGVVLLVLRRRRRI